MKVPLATRNSARPFQKRSIFCRIFLWTGCLWLIGCSGQKPASAPPKLYALHGTVLSLNSTDHTATIKADRYRVGWMP